MDITSIIILAVIVIALAADLVYIFRRKGRKGSCCGDCSACSQCATGNRRISKTGAEYSGNDKSGEHRS